MLIILIPRPVSILAYHLSLIHLRVFFFFLISFSTEKRCEVEVEREKEREKKIEGWIPSRTFRKYLPFVCRHFRELFLSFLVLPWACYHSTYRFFGWKIANRFGSAWLNFSGERWRLYRSFHSRRVFSYLGWKGLLMSRVFQASPTDKQWIDLLVKYVQCRNYFLHVHLFIHPYFSSNYYSFWNNILFIPNNFILYTYHLPLSRFMRKT